MGATLGGEHAELLSQVELFRGLDRVTLAKLVAHLEPLSLSAGDILFRQGDPPDGLYLVSRGTFAIYAAPAPGSDDEITFSICGRGESFGEIALLTNATRTATVRAQEDGELLKLDQARFLDLVRRDPSVGLAISASLIRRLRVADAARLGLADSTTASMPPPETIQVAPLKVRWHPSRWIGLGLAVAVILIGWLLPPPTGLSVAGWHALISLVALVPILTLEALPDGATSLLLVLVWVVGGIVPPRAALSGFATTTWILTVSVFAVGAAVATSGLLYRLALAAVARAPGFRSQVVTLGVAGMFIGPAVPNATGRMSLVASAIAELAEALGYQPGSRVAAGLAMAAMVGFGQMSAGFLTSSSTSLLAFALLPDSTKASLNWAVWAVRAAPLHAIVLVGLMAFIIWRYAPRGSTAPAPSPPVAALGLQRTLLGRPSRHEIIAGLVTVGLLIGFATQSLHGVDPSWIAVAAFVVMAGTGVLGAEELRIVNWNTVLLLGVLASMAEVVSTTKLDAWIAALASGAVGSLGREPAQIGRASCRERVSYHV